MYNVLFYKVILIALGVGLGSTSWANDTSHAATTDNSTPQQQAVTPLSSEDKAYQEAMVTLSQAISQKISEIQAKQQEINNEIYPAYVPPLQQELLNLKNQLKELELQRDQLQTQKASREIQKQLNSGQ